MTEPQTMPPALSGPDDPVPELATTAAKTLRTDMGLTGRRRKRLTRYIRAIEVEAAARERELLRANHLSAFDMHAYATPLCGTCNLLADPEDTP